MPSVFVDTDTPDTGWDYQSDQGHQAAGTWLDNQLQWHINAKELWVPLRLIRDRPTLTDLSITFRMDNQVAVRCINQQGFTKSLRLCRFLRSSGNVTISG